ncbi:MAG: hypothetical protein L6R42_002340 [Xanthoria sp. 1 TBL-2021]|nr:MAG: hypothetical protein L6R42_002340 [Xanthoria sp. 1 TBL-2021]
MPQDDENKSKKSNVSPKTGDSSWLTTPRLIRHIFDKFPLVTHPLNELPNRRPIERNKNTLHIFAREGEARRGAPSFNPSCLKWQTYLKLTGVDFVTVSSNNHASPTGSLPFMIPAASSAESTILDVVRPIPSHKIQEWAGKHCATSRTESDSIRYEAYLSLLDHRIRNAWLHTLYLSVPNFDAVARPLYISPATSAPPARLALSHSLQTAALEELTKASTSSVIDLSALYRESDNAFSALSELLGGDDWFFGEAEPGLFDAGVFAYTHLLCDENMGWKPDEERLGNSLREGKWKNLVEHERRVFDRCYR